jgi:hypothetical protein
MEIILNTLIQIDEEIKTREAQDIYSKIKEMINSLLNRVKGFENKRRKERERIRERMGPSKGLLSSRTQAFDLINGRFPLGQSIKKKFYRDSFSGILL